MPIFTALLFVRMAGGVAAGPMQKRLTLVAVIGMSYWFFGNLYEAIVFSPKWQWNVLNVVRMALTGTTAWYLFTAFRKLDRRPENAARPRGCGSPSPTNS